MAAELRSERSRPLSRITLDRPERRNALDPEIMGLLLAALMRAGRDPEVRVVVLGGAGLAMAKIKEPVDRALDASLDEVLENERFHRQDIFRTEDFAEGVQAFLQRRPAVYKGR